MAQKKTSASTNIKVENITGTSGELNIAGGHIIHAAQGATVIIEATVDEAAKSLSALSMLMQKSPSVRQSVAEFQAEFRVAHEQVAQLGDYKDLHDLLHELQLQCFNRIVQCETRFPNDKLTFDELSDHLLTLEDIVEKLKQISSRSTMTNQNLKWIEEIPVIMIELRTAIENGDKTNMQNVIGGMKRILTKQPPRINAFLNSTARELRLHGMKEALLKIFNNLMSLNPAHEETASFRSGVDALVNLDTAVKNLVHNHDSWQELDSDLRLTDSQIDLYLKSLESLKTEWQAIRDRANPLYTKNTEEWAKKIKQDSDNMDLALNSNNPNEIQRAFQKYYNRVSIRFFLVDKELKELCGSLRQIDMPLNSVLRMI